MKESKVSPALATVLLLVVVLIFAGLAYKMFFTPKESTWVPPAGYGNSMGSGKYPGVVAKPGYPGGAGYPGH